MNKFLPVTDFNRDTNIIIEIHAVFHDKLEKLNNNAGVRFFKSII